jgi:hypothetical protein
MHHVIWIIATGNYSDNWHITSLVISTVILIINGHSGITRAHCYYDLYIYSVIVFPQAECTVISQICTCGGQEKLKNKGGRF